MGVVDYCISDSRWRLLALLILQPLECCVFQPQKSRMRWFTNNSQFKNEKLLYEEDSHFKNERAICDATETIHEY